MEYTKENIYKHIDVLSKLVGCTYKQVSYKINAIMTQLYGFDRANVVCGYVNLSKHLFVAFDCVHSIDKETGELVTNVSCNLELLDSKGNTLIRRRKMPIEEAWTIVEKAAEGKEGIELL